MCFLINNLFPNRLWNQQTVITVIADKINLKTTLGGFRAGDAYGDAQDETALRAKIDLNVRF